MTVYVGRHYEVRGGTVIKYYHANGQRIAMRKGGVVYYLHGDHLGSTSLTTNGNGGVHSRQLYHPYGEVRWSKSTLPTEYQFTGQRHETDLGLYDYRARYYHPALGRFISADAIVPEPGNPQDLNRYAYVRNNPLGYTDPTGHFSDQEIMDFFGVDTWFDVLSIFDPGGELEGKWNWLRTLKYASEGDAVQINYWNGDDVDLTLFEGTFEVSRDGNLYLEGIRSKLSILEAGRLEYANVWGAFVHYRYTGSGRAKKEPISQPHWVYFGEGLYNPGDRFHFNPSRVNWGDTTLDVVGAAASVVGANSFVEATHVSSEVAQGAQVVDAVLGGGGVIKGLLVDQDPNSAILAAGGFIPGPVGGGFNLASVYFDLEEGFRIAP